MQYRKKPVVVESVQFTLEILEAHFFDGKNLPEGVEIKGSTLHPPTRQIQGFKAVIKTLEGEMQVSLDDWIITGVQGEHYPCKPDIFAATYEPVVEQPDTSGYVSCGCGDMYPPDSYGAGYIHGAGQCENCDAAQPTARKEQS